jgi:hypothetical protein
MYYATKFVKKVNHIRHQNWSAPAIMGAFIFICMIVIFSFESLGLTNKEKNLQYRITTPEKLIKIVSNDIERNKKDCANKNKTCNVQYNSSENENSPDMSNMSPLIKNNFIFEEGKSIRYQDKELLLHNKIRSLAKLDKESHIQQMMKILFEGAYEQVKFENMTNVLEKMIYDEEYQNDELNIDFFDV